MNTTLVLETLKSLIRKQQCSVISLYDLREEMGVAMADLHQAVKELRRQRLVILGELDGFRYPSCNELFAAIRDGVEYMSFVSLCS